MKTEDLKRPFYMYGNKGALWNNKAHIAESGSFSGRTLCGVPMLASNWCKIEKLDEVNCPDCLHVYKGKQKVG